MMKLLQSFHDKVNEHSSATSDHKNVRQWFLDVVNPESFPSQKQAVEAPIFKPIFKPESGFMYNARPIGNSLGFQSFANKITDRVGRPDSRPFGVPLSSNALSFGNSLGFESVPNQFRPANSTKRNRSSDISPEDSNKRCKNDSYVIGSSSSYVVEHDLSMSMNQADTKGSEKGFVSSKERSRGQKVENVPSMDRSYGTNNAVKTTHSHSQRDSEIYQGVMDDLRTPVSSCSLSYEESPPVQTSKTSRKKVNVPNGKSRQESTPNKKTPNKFPTNVKSLTGTGMLDGVPVLYSSASREKQLRGIIKGSSYLCGCSMCNYSNEVNAYEFERHAGCKTSHPNNHIRFANWKTIHQIVQELKNTPDSMLVDAIQTITGSPINQQAFVVWKGIMSS